MSFDAPQGFPALPVPGRPDWLREHTANPIIVMDAGRHYLRVTPVVHQGSRVLAALGEPVEPLPLVEQVFGVGQPEDAAVQHELRNWMSSERLAKYRQGRYYYDPSDFSGSDIPNAAAALLLNNEYLNVRNVLTRALLLKSDLLGLVGSLGVGGVGNDLPGLPMPADFDYDLLALYNLAVLERRTNDWIEFEKTIKSLRGLDQYEELSLAALSLVREIRSIT